MKARSTDELPRACIVRFFDSDEIHGRREADALAESGFDTEFLCVARPGEPAREQVGNLTIRRFRVSKARQNKLTYLGSYLRWFFVCFVHLTVGQFRGGGYDVVQISTLPDHQVFAAFVPRLCGARVVLFFKEPAAELFELEFGAGIGRAVGLIAKLAARFATICLTVTEAHRRDYIAKGVPGAKIAAVSNATPEHALPPAPPEPIPADEIVVVSHGTVEERWGYEVMLRGFAKALVDRPPDCPPMRLVLTGKGSFEDDVRRLIEVLGLSERVEFRGFVSVPELAALIARADIGLVAQLSNGYSNLVHTGKMYDFIMRGVPVVASRLDATAEDFPSLAFFEPGNADDLARVLLELVQDPQLRGAHAVEADVEYQPLRWNVQRPRYVSLVTGLEEVG